MSNEALTWAWKQAVGPAKIVLVALADFADEKGSCWPSIARLAGMTGMGNRTIERHLLSLADTGFLRRTRRRFEDGKLGGYRYYLAVFEAQIRPKPEQTPVANMAGGERAKSLKNKAQPVANLAGGTSRQKRQKPVANLAGQEEPPLEPSIQQQGARGIGKIRAGPLPVDWAPGEDLIQFAKNELRFTNEEMNDAIREFRDYWTARARQRTHWRLDWSRAFKNRLRQLDPLWHRTSGGGGPGAASSRLRHQAGLQGGSGGHQETTENVRGAWAKRIADEPGH